MANEALRAAAAANRDVPDKPPEPSQDCADVVHLAIFFDGTGNNKDADEVDKKWSNVATLWRAVSSFQSTWHPDYPLKGDEAELKRGVPIVPLPRN